MAQPRSEGTPLLATGNAPGAPVRHSLSSGYVDFSSSTTAFYLGLLYIFVYLVLAVVAYSYVFEKWSIIDSIYFAVVTFTTVGYGDLSPTTDAGRVFTIFFAIYGISILGLFLGIIGDRVLNAQLETLQNVEAAAKERIMSVFKREEEAIETAEKKRDEIKDPSYLDDFKSLAHDKGPISIFILVVALAIGQYEKWTIASSVYYWVVTSTTVGFGDMTPDTQYMRLVAIFFTPLCVAVFGAILGEIAGFYLERKSNAAERQFLQRELTARDLKEMDINDDGKVTYGEFLSFMLVAMQKIDKESVEELRGVFDALDIDKSGALDKTDLQKLSEEKLGAPTHVPTPVI